MKRRDRQLIRAAAPTIAGDKVLTLTAAAHTVKIEAAGEAGGVPKLELVAYTGVPMDQWWLDHPVVVDLATMKFSKQDGKGMPILYHHDSREPVGHITEVVNAGGSLVIKGLASGGSTRTDEVVKAGKNGYPWQCSIGADPGSIEFIGEGISATINGQIQNGPIYVARGVTLYEVSVLSIGADQNTSGRLAAQRKGENVNFKAYVESLGFEFAKLTAEQRDKLEAQYTKLEAAKGGDADAPASPAADKPAAKPAEQPASAAPIQAAATVGEGVMSLRAERARIADIEAACGSTHPEILAKAVKEGWTIEATKTQIELHDLRAARPNVPNFISNGKSLDTEKVIEAALLVQCGMPQKEVAAKLGEQAVDAATAPNFREQGLHGLVRAALEAAGEHVGKINTAALERLQKIRASGMTSVSFTGILNNTADKLLLRSFLAVNAIAPMICSKRTVSDFKTVQANRLSATGSMSEVGPAGELKSAKLVDEQYTNRAKTIGEIMMLTRQDIINDDLHAFQQIPNILGRRAAIAREKAVFTPLLANASNFFGTGHKNYLSGSTYALSIAALTAGRQKFLEQVDSAGDPVMITPKILLVPPALHHLGGQLCTDKMVNETTTANAAKPNSNPHAGQFTCLVSPFLGTVPAISGASNTGWYLIADPADVPLIEIAYVNGVETPVIEEVPAPSDVLGVAYRGYYDFGVALQDYRAGVFANGA